MAEVSKTSIYGGGLRLGKIQNVFWKATEDDKKKSWMRMALLQAIDYAKRHNVDTVESWSEDRKFHHVFTKEELENGYAFYKECGWDR